MTDDENRREKYSMRELPAPMTVGQLREQLAALPDDATVRYLDYKTPEYSDWYTDVLHVVGIDQDGTLHLGSNADYLIRDEEPDWFDDENDEDQNRPPMPAAAAGDDGLLDWERELLEPAKDDRRAGSSVLDDPTPLTVEQIRERCGVGAEVDFPIMPGAPVPIMTVPITRGGNAQA